MPSLNQSMNHEGVYRTAPATPGLLKINLHNNFCLCKAQGSLVLKLLASEIWACQYNFLNLPSFTYGKPSI